MYCDTITSTMREFVLHVEKQKQPLGEDEEAAITRMKSFLAAAGAGKPILLEPETALFFNELQVCLQTVSCFEPS